MSHPTYDAPLGFGPSKALAARGTLQQPPHYTSGRYSAQNLSHDYQEVLDCHDRQNTRSRRAGSTTPTPTTPPVAPLALSGGSEPRSKPASTGLGNYTHLTIPESDDEAVYGVVQSIAVPNPFKTPVQQDAMDVLCEEDKADAVLLIPDLSSGAELTPVSNNLRGRGQSVRVEDDKPISILKPQPGSATNDRPQVVLHQLTTGEQSPSQASADRSSTGQSPTSQPSSVDPNYETNGNWDLHEKVQERLPEYEAFRDSIEGHENWTETQAFLHKLIGLRGVWPVLQRSWTFYFRMRNIYPWVYAPQDSQKTVVINAKSNEFRAAKALEVLFDLSPLVGSYRTIGKDTLIGPSIRRAIKRYILWAMRDAGLEDRKYIPTLKVYEFDPAAYAGDDGCPSSTGDDGGPSSTGDDDGSEKDPISDEVDKRLRKLAAEYRRKLVREGFENQPEADWQYQSQPPLLIAFVIVQYMVMVVTLDSARPGSLVTVSCELDMREVDQWLWNALAIAFPVHLARDALWDVKETLPVVVKPEEVDPDL